ncbi:carbohydrate porin [Pseudomonadota bacterium]
MEKIIFLTLLAIPFLSFAGDESSAPLGEREQLTGAWGGKRTSLEESGITPFAYYDGIFGANVSGGISKDQAYTGQFYAGVDLDLEKLIGWEATTMKISTVDRHGNTISPSVGGIYDPMTIYGGQVLYLYQLFIETGLKDNWFLKLGRVSADSDFANNDLYRYSLSTSINGPIRALLLDNSITSFPYAVWGGRLKFRPSEEHQFQIGAYQTGPEQWDYTKHGLDFSIYSDDGVSILLQYDWRSQLFDRPTHVFVGVVNSFRDFDNFTGGGTTDFVFRSYIHMDIEVSDGFKLFGLATFSDEDQVAKTPLQISGGMNYEGLIPGREDDHTVAFITYGQLSEKYGDSIGEDVTSEMVFEIGYRIQATPAIYLQPSVQYIKNPGGTGSIDNALVLGAWISGSF